MKVMLDIGAHVGETLEVVLDPRWGFERIFCFEPAPQCWPALEALADQRVEVLRFGLWDRNAALDLIDPGTIGASVFAAKGRTDEVCQVAVRDAADWFRECISSDDEVIVKMNCEGAECEILDRLIDSREIDKISTLVVHFDVSKVPGLEHREAQVRRRLDAVGTDYHAATDIFYGRDVHEKTRNWLTWYHAGKLGRLRHVVLRRAEFAVRLFVYRQRSGRRDHQARGTR